MRGGSRELIRAEVEPDEAAEELLRLGIARRSAGRQRAARVSRWFPRGPGSSSSASSSSDSSGSSSRSESTSCWNRKCVLLLALLVLDGVAYITLRGGPARAYIHDANAYWSRATEIDDVENSTAENSTDVDAGLAMLIADSRMLPYTAMDRRMPYYLLFASTVSKLYISLFVFGPEEATTSQKSAAKSAFQVLLLGLFYVTCFYDCSRTVDAFMDHDLTLWQKYMAWALIWGDSPNMQTAAAMNGLGIMFTAGRAFPQCHTTRMPYDHTDADGQPLDSQKLISQVHGNSVGLLRHWAMGLYLWPSVIGIGPLLVFAFALLFWIIIPLKELAVRFLTPVFSMTALHLKKHGFCLIERVSDEDMEQRQLIELTDSEEMRQLLINALEGHSIRNYSDDKVRVAYQVDLEFFRYLGTTRDRVDEFACWQFLWPLFTSWAPLVVIPIFNWMAWEEEHTWSGFIAAYFRGLVLVFGSRHWWLYRDHLVASLIGKVNLFNRFF